MQVEQSNRYFRRVKSIKTKESDIEVERNVPGRWINKKKRKKRDFSGQATNVKKRNFLIIFIQWNEFLCSISFFLIRTVASLALNSLCEFCTL